MDNCLPCPFCGGVALDFEVNHFRVFDNGGADYKDDAFYWIECQRCEGVGPADDSKEKALERWNTRNVVN